MNLNSKRSERVVKTFQELPMSQKDEIIAVLKDLFSDKSDFALLFGSWARDEARITADSDVDCGVFLNEDIPVEILYGELPTDFYSRTGRELDIVRLNDADIIIASQIVMTGEPVFVNSEERFDAYRVKILSLYFDFKKSRKIIEDRILVKPRYGQ